MKEHRTGIGIVGAGVISAEYVCFLAARKPDHGPGPCPGVGVSASGAYEDLLADPSIDVAVNLTVPQAHAEITEQALESGRHVYSEKPLALSRSDERQRPCKSSPTVALRT